MSICAKIYLIYISIGFCLILGVESYNGGSNHTITVQRGGSVTIPCHYDEKYTQQKKSWYSGFDQSYKYTNTTEENLSVIDHPDQSLFTVTMRNLQETHNGDYYCIVKDEENKTVPYYEFSLQVKPAPKVSVMNSSVSGHEGDDVRVQCFYSSTYKNELKRWCRYKAESCFTENNTDTSQNSSVQISDDGERSFTVLMTGLRLSDSGWYFCSVENHITSVQLTVTEASSDTVSLKTNELLTVWLPVSAALLLMLALAVVYIWIRRRRPKQDDQKIRQRNNSSSSDPMQIYSETEDPVVYSTINDETPNDLNKDTTYSTTDYISGSEAPPAGGLYSTVQPH